MIDLYFIDKIVILKVTEDKYGVRTESPTEEIDARVEDWNKLVTDKNGNEVMANMLVFFNDGVDLDYQDKIILKTKGGVATLQPDKKFLIKSIGLVDGFERSHYEVYL